MFPPFDSLHQPDEPPGGGPVAEAVFYSYMYPEPPGFAEAPVTPPEAYYHPVMREFFLPWAAVRAAADPAATALSFLESTYRAGADLAGWDREALESPWLREPGDPRGRFADTTTRRAP